MKMLNCPFCGSKPRQYETNEHIFSCSNDKCPAWDILCHPHEWNRRSVPPQVDETLATFAIGSEFTTIGSEQRYRVTDVGSRVVVAIRLDQEDVRNYNGPPYSIAEIVFDEFDQGGCHGVASG